MLIEQLVVHRLSRAWKVFFDNQLFFKYDDFQLLLKRFKEFLLFREKCKENTRADY